MTPEQKKIVKDTWAAVIPIQEQAAELFYGRLFSEHPEVKPMFKGDMQAQGEKLMKMIDQAVGSLDDLEPFIEPLKAAGKAHKGYGVAKGDYAKVGSCLLWTLEQGLGDSYNASVQNAWGAAYTTLSTVMIEGAEYDVVKAKKPAEKKSWIKSMFARA